MSLKTVLTLVALCWASLAIGQETFKTCYVANNKCISLTYAKGSTVCSNAHKHIVYRAPVGQSPKRLARLGSNPQFGTLKNYTTTQEVYDHLKRAYKENSRGNAAELDKLWTAMGYNGFNDARFTVAQLTPVFYDVGVEGMLGAGGNTYLYAKVYHNNESQVKGYRVSAIEGCDVTIMEICGNAFYPQTPNVGNKIVSRNECPIDQDVSNKTVYSFAKDGKCHVRVCDKAVGKQGEMPQTVTNLAHNSQFGSMVDAKTTQDVYDRLKALHTENKNGNAAELDRLLRSVGYTGGLNDPNFNTSQIEIIRYEGGVAAVMGGGEHQYMYSEIATEKYDVLRGFRIKSQNEKCDLVIIDVCGNALYCPQPINCQTFECNCG